MSGVTSEHGHGIVVTYYPRYTTGGPADPDITSLRVNGRPLVVIDPEDDADLTVAHLADAVIAEACGYRIDRAIIGVGLRAGLRSLIAPPKPPEPENFAAAVEDRRGNHWTRAYQPGCGATGKGAWYCGDLRSHYADIDVVRVLSEGVTP